MLLEHPVHSSYGVIPVPIYSLSFAPDSRLLLSSSRDCTVRLWQTELRSNLVVYRVAQPVWQAQFSPRGYYFATSAGDGCAMVWATDKMQPIRMFADAFSDVSCLDWHPNCNYLVGGSDDRYVRVWDLMSGQCVRVFSGHKGAVRSVKVSSCGRYLISIGAEGAVVVWDLAMQRMLSMQETTSCTAMASIALSRDGSAFAVGRPDSAVSIFSLDTATAITDNVAMDPRINPPGFHLATYPTKQTPIVNVHFTRRNLLLAFGAFGQ